MRLQVNKKFTLKQHVQIVGVPDYDALYNKTGVILGTSFYAHHYEYIVLLDTPLAHALAVTVEERHLRLVEWCLCMFWITYRFEVLLQALRIKRLGIVL